MQLQRAIIALAQSADVQLSLFPNFVYKGDELALDFDDGRLDLVGRESNLNLSQRLTVDALDQLLTSMSDAGNSELWTDEAIRNSAVWEDVRVAAKAAAAAFGWDIQIIPPSDAIYVPGGR